jgi:hypothetical protein
MIDRRIRNIIPAAVICFMFLSIYACEDFLADKESEQENEEIDSTFYRIISPNGGEIFNEQDTVSIAWSSGGDVDDFVKLYYSKDPDTNWIQISSIIGNDGLYNWVLPNLDSSSGSSLFKVRDYIDSELYDISDAYFTMTADSTYLRITAPNGGETWEELSTHTITWESSGEMDFDDSKALYYSVDSGENWIQIVYLNYGNSYSWTLPQTFITNSTCRVKIQDHNRNIEDISDADFTISVGGSQTDILTVQSANGGEVWHEQTTQEIRWYTSGDIGGNDIYIGYSTDGGTTWNDVVDGNSNSNEETDNPPSENFWDKTDNGGSYNWTLPNFSDTLDQCIIGIWSAANTSLYDASDNFFTISCDSNYYRILYPNGGEEFQMGTNRTIFWESGGDAGSVSLYYSLYGGESWYEIDPSESNDGSYTWSVPTIQGTNELCRIKIQDYNQTGWYDISDNNFTIADTVIFDSFDMSFESGEDTTGWTFGGSWTIDSGDAYSGSNFAYNGGGNGSLSYAVATGEGVFRFFYKGMSNNTTISFSFSIDGDPALYLGNYYDIDWTIAEFWLEEGYHTFEWVASYPWYEYLQIDAINFP